MSKIFQLINSIQLGGAEIVAFNLSEFCKSNTPLEFEFVVVELHKTKEAYSIEKKKELDSKNVRTISLSKSSKRLSLFFGTFALAYQLLKERPDIIHSHTDLPDFVLSNVIRLFSILRIKTPIIVRTIHNSELWPTHRRLGKYTETVFVNDRIVGVSEAAINSYNNLRLKNDLPVSNYKQIIYNGCVVPKRKEHPFKIDTTKINIAFCGRLENQKGIDILIERIKQINKRFGDVFLFHIIGSGTYLHEVLHLSKKYTNILVYDAVPNVSDKLYEFDFIIMPSRFEGLGLISIEASFSKVPVIAAFAPGLTETLPIGWPLNFHLLSEEALLAIFEKISKHQYDLEVLKEQVYQFVSEKFSHNGMVNAYSKLYTEING
jgi:glycosyltransferase involved in cell wall biosynthesis